MSRIIHRSAGKYPLSQKRRRTYALGEGGRGEEVTHPDAVDATTAMITKQETKFHPYPEWRERMLQKCVASGRHGFLTSPAWRAKWNLSTGEYELPRRLQKWRDDEEEEAEGEEAPDDEESEVESLMSDAEWEGWRRELELEGSTRPNSPGLNIAQDGSPWTSESTQQSSLPEFIGLPPSRRRKNTLISGRDRVLEEIVKRTTEHSVHPYSMHRAQVSGASTLSSISPSASIVADTVASSVVGLGLAAARASSPSISPTVSIRQLLPIPNRPTHDANHDLAIPLPNLSDVSEDGPLPGLGGGLSSSYRPYHTVTTISAPRSADSEVIPKKGMARVWSNKGKRRDRIEDNPTGEEAGHESQPLAVDYPNDAWTRSYDEGLDRLRHMSSSGLRRSGSNHGLFKSLRDR